MARGRCLHTIVLGVLLSFVAFGVVAPCALGLTLRGHRANNTIVVRATGVASGRYSIDGGRWVRFGGIHSLTIDGAGGHDVCQIVNPRRGLFARAPGSRAMAATVRARRAEGFSRSMAGAPRRPRTRRGMDSPAPAR